MARDYEYLFSQLQRIEDHREEKAEKEIRKLYKKILKETKQFISEEYYQLAEDGKLTYEILRAKGRDARFLKAVEEKLGGLSIGVSDEIKKTVEEMYQLAYDGVRSAVMSGKDTAAFFEGVDMTTANKMQSTVDNAIMEIALEKNHKDITWGIKREIATALTVGDRFETLAHRIADNLDRSYTKGILIARTEMHRVREAGHLASAKDIDETLQKGSSGMRMVKKWKTMKDGVVRPQSRYKTKKGWKTGKIRPGAPDHVKMHDVVVLEDELFDLGGGVKTTAPGQSGVAGHDCNCRCKALHFLMDDEEFFKATGRHFPNYVGDIVEVFKTNDEYMDNDGNFDLDGAKADYTEFLKGVPEKNRAVLEYAFKTTPFVETTDPRIVFGYSQSEQCVLYNIQNKLFKHVQFNVALTHELGHRIDDLFQMTVRSKALTKAVNKAEKVMLSSLEKFKTYSAENDEDGFITDIFSAISKTDEFRFGHSPDYWKKPGRREAEIYANIFSLEVNGDQKKLKYLKKNFPDIMDAYDSMDFEV